MPDGTGWPVACRCCACWPGYRPGARRCRGRPCPTATRAAGRCYAALTAATLGLAASLSAAGEPAPLAFLPLFNPLELVQLATLGLLARAALAPGARTQGWPGAVALLGALTITLMVLRAVHYLAGVAWNAPAMLDSQTAQAALTITWTVMGVIAWVGGSRRGLRGLWLAGAVVLGVVLVKLLLVDRSYLSNVAGIVSFLGFGLLSVLVGYLAPAPPRKDRHTEETTP